VALAVSYATGFVPKAGLVDEAPRAVTSLWEQYGDRL